MWLIGVHAYYGRTELILLYPIFLPVRFDSPDARRKLKIFFDYSLI